MLPDATPVDTEPTAASMLVNRWRAMSIGERADLIRQLCLDVERIARAGILASHPDASELEIVRELARRRYGNTLASDAYAGAVPCG